MLRSSSKASTIPWAICILVGIFYGYDYLLRVMPSVMIYPMMQSYHINVFQFGLFSACYFYAYTPMQFLTGAFIDKYSRRWVLFITCLFSTLGVLILANADNITLAYIGRIIMAMGSAYAFVGALKMASLRLPQRHFASFVALLLSFGILGAVIADVVLSRGITHLGWENTVLLTSCAGFLLAILMILFVKDRPYWLPKPPPETSSFGQLLIKTCQQFKNVHIWLIGLVGACALLPITVFASLWWSMFLNQSYHFTNVDASQTTALIFIGFAVGAPFFVWWSNKIKRRRLPVIIGTTMVFITISCAIYIPHLPKSILFGLQVLIGFFTATHALLFAMAREINPPRYTGVTMAAVNCLVSLGALVFQPWVGYFLSRHWHGQVTLKTTPVMPAGTPMYGMPDYYYAFAILVVILFLAIIMACFLPETRCEMKHSEMRQRLDKATVSRGC